MKNIPSLEEQQASVPFVESSDFTKAFHAERKARDFGEPWKLREEWTMCPFFNRDGIIVAEFEQRSAACVNACAGMQDPAAEIEAMRAAIREAHEALGGCLKYILRLPLSGSDSECETMDDAHHALRKLKTFLP